MSSATNAVSSPQSVGNGTIQPIVMNGTGASPVKPTISPGASPSSSFVIPPTPFPTPTHGHVSTSPSGSAIGRRIKVVGNYDLGRTIGKGQFGKVKIARHVLTGEKVAVKIIRKFMLDDNTMKLVRREINIMKLLKHPHIIRLYEVMETEKLLFLIMEYASGGEVLDFIVAHGRLQEPLARRFFQQIVLALEYCHARCVVHRDLKAENLLLDSDLSIKIIDFGLSNHFTPGQMMKTFCGSPTYAAPELIQKKEYCGPEADVWSLGVVLYVFVCGALPFNGHDFLSLFTKILNGDYQIPDHVSPDCRDLIQRMLVVNPEFRATLDDVKNHRWLSSETYAIPDNPPALDTIKSLEVDPSSLDETILKHMEIFGYSREAVESSIRANQCNAAAATYILLLEKKTKIEASPTRLSMNQLPTATRRPKAPAQVTRRGHRRTQTADSPIVVVEKDHHGAPVSASAQITLQQQQQQQQYQQQLYLYQQQLQLQHQLIQLQNQQKGVQMAPKNTMAQPAVAASPSAPPQLLTAPKSQPTPSGHRRTRSGDMNNQPIELDTCSPKTLLQQQQQLLVQQQLQQQQQVYHRRSPSLSKPPPLYPTQPQPTQPPPSLQLPSPPQSQLTQPPIGKGSHRRTISIATTTQPKKEADVHPTKRGDDDDFYFVPSAAPMVSPRRHAPTHSHHPTPVTHIIPPSPDTERKEIEAIAAIPPTPKDLDVRSLSPSASPSIDNTVHTETTPQTNHDKITLALEEEEAAAKALSNMSMEDQKDKNKTGLSSFISSLKAWLKKDGTNTPSTSTSDAKSSTVEPRAVRSALTVTSAKAPEAILSEIKRVLGEHGVKGKLTSAFCFECQDDSMGESLSVTFEMEVCNLPGLSKVYYIRTKRIGGDWGRYKTICRELIDDMKL
eukprot:TRINITY_DN206_c0_g8_i1.p1 TRINITY_DN206_c0_g8~~TRINITY_DN206_c0_g8_i1.p1  ORF type:complete len:898 (-),score=181.60 TRINITY_DN206_c0_g8_i1:97-2790(-)